MERVNEFQMEQNSPVLSLADAMRKMKAVLDGKAPIPAKSEMPLSKTYYNDQDALNWHRGAIARKAVFEVPSMSDRVSLPVIASEEFSAFAKLYVDNGELLRILANEGADSIASLAAKLGKDAGNVARTLKKFEHFGLVHLEPVGPKTKKPTLSASVMDMQLDFRTGRMYVSV